MSFGVKICYLRGIFGASSGRSGAEELCYKGTKKNRDMQVFYAIKFAFPIKKRVETLFFTNKAIFFIATDQRRGQGLRLSICGE